MKTVHKLLRKILNVAVLVMLASCATDYIPNESSVQSISVKDARQTLVTQLKESYIVYVEYKDFARITKVYVSSNRLTVTDEKGKQSVFLFKKLPEIISLGRHGNTYMILLPDRRTPGIDRQQPGGVNDIAKALYVLKRNAINQSSNVDEADASFEAALADYRKKAVSNTALPEDANKYKVQAEGAVRDKDFDAAGDFYAKALEIVPWWPVGHFNRALVLGEIGDYEIAIREMKYYLQLVPDAPNARAAQDKIYDWERKMGDGN